MFFRLVKGNGRKKRREKGRARKGGGGAPHGRFSGGDHAFAAGVVYLCRRSRVVPGGPRFADRGAEEGRHGIVRLEEKEDPAAVRADQDLRLRRGEVPAIGEAPVRRALLALRFPFGKGEEPAVRRQGDISQFLRALALLLREIKDVVLQMIAVFRKEEFV